MGLPTFSVMRAGLLRQRHVDGSARDLTVQLQRTAAVYRIERLLHQARLDHVAHRQHRRPGNQMAPLSGTGRHGLGNLVYEILAAQYQGGGT